MGKAILLVRVSTERQQFDEQERQLYQMAIDDGFKDSEIIPIAEKESGIKLKEEERKGLNRMKEEIEKGDVSVVYAWEISRIARKKKIIFSITELLQEKGIQLIIREPYIKLLNPDGSINDAAETILTLFAQMAESEMRNKQSRWSRTRRANALEGKWNGGTKPMYGYRIDENNYFQINEEEANVVRLVYDIYVNTDLGQGRLRKELLSRGIKLSEDRIRRILSRIAYTGEPYVGKVWDKEKNAYKDGNTIILPPIIDKETYEKAMAKKDVINGKAVRRDSFYFAKNLMKCPHCGHAYVGYRLLKVYECIAYKHDNKDIEKCNNSNTININVLDTILWHDAKNEYAAFLAGEKEESLSETKERINVIEEKLNVCLSKVESIQQRYKKLRAEYIIGDMSVEERDSLKDRIAKDEADNNNQIEYLKGQLNQLQKQYDELNGMVNEDNFSFLMNWGDFLKDINNNEYALKDMYDIVHKFISRVEVERKEGTKKCYWKVTVYHPERLNPLTNEMEEEKNIYIGYCYNDNYRYWSIPTEYPHLSKQEAEDAIKNGYYYYKGQRFETEQEFFPQQILRKLGKTK